MKTPWLGNIMIQWTNMDQENTSRDVPVKKGDPWCGQPSGQG